MGAPVTPADDRPVTAGRRFGRRVWGAFLCGFGLLVSAALSFNVIGMAVTLLSADGRAGLRQEDWAVLIVGGALQAALGLGGAFLVYRGARIFIGL